MDTQKELSDLLYNHYLEHLAVDAPEAEGFKEELTRLLQELCFREKNRIVCAVNAMCAEQERYAFLEGVRLGVRMICTLTR